MNFFDFILLRIFLPLNLLQFGLSHFLNEITCKVEYFLLDALLQPYF